MQLELIKRWFQRPTGAPAPGRHFCGGCGTRIEQNRAMCVECWVFVPVCLQEKIAEAWAERGGVTPKGEHAADFQFFSLVAQARRAVQVCRQTPPAKTGASTNGND